MIRKIWQISILLMPLAAQAEAWLYDKTYLTGGLAYESKMPDEDKFEGVKLVLAGRHIISGEDLTVDEKRLCCEIPAKPFVYRGVLNGKLQFGIDGNGLEYASLGLTPWAKMWEPGVESDDSFQARRDLLEIGVTRYVKDKPLELEDYLELGFFRAGRLGEYKPSPDSAWTFDIGVQAAAGWAWARSESKEYSRVSNPYAGIYGDLAIQHDRFGSIYFVGRFINGFSFSNPSRGYPTAREANVRSGYAKMFGDNLKLDVYWQKRSFYFDEGDLPSLYTWVRTYGAELNWYFGG